MPPAAYPESPQGIFFRRLPIACAVVTRGCPGACTFCAGHTIQGHRIRSRTTGNVVSEIQQLKKDHGVREMHFLDDNLSARPAFASALCEAFIENRLDITWCCPNGLRLDTLDAALLSLMKRSGCHSVSVGIESGSQAVLDAARKGLRLDDIEEKVRLMRRAGLEVCAFFILGFPMDTPETIRETIRFARRLPLHRATFSSYLPLPGSGLTNRMLESGELGGIDFAHLFQADTPYAPPGMTPVELKVLQRKAFLSFFLRPRILLGVLRNIRTAKQLKYILQRIVTFLG
jgi:anaerobic magnesium-protoporphyrin IX monomethyl ester cyclase